MHSTGEQPSAAQTAGRADSADERKETVHNNHGKHISTVHSTPARSIRLRGGGGESQEHLDALTTLSENNSATFTRIMRKAFVMMYNAGDNDISDIFDRWSLIGINQQIDDDEVADAAWQTYGVRITWSDDDDAEADEDAYSYADYETEDDTYYDANESWDEWSEGDVYIGALT